MDKTDRPDPRTPIPDSPTPPENANQHENYHKRIMLVAGVFAGVGAAFAAVLLLVVLVRKPESLSLRAVLGPVGFGFGGYMFGMSVMCLFAPTAFLTGPVGRSWMRMIGTKSVVVARIACLVFGLIATAIGVGLGFLFVMMLLGK